MIGPPEFVRAYNALAQKAQEYEKLIREAGPSIKTYIPTDQEAMASAKRQVQGSQERRDYEAIARQGTKEALTNELLDAVDYQSWFLPYRWEGFKQRMGYFYGAIGSLSQHPDKSKVLKDSIWMLRYSVQDMLYFHRNYSAPLHINLEIF